MQQIPQLLVVYLHTLNVHVECGRLLPCNNPFVECPDQGMAAHFTDKFSGPADDQGLLDAAAFIALESCVLIHASLRCMTELMKSHFCQLVAG